MAPDVSLWAAAPQPPRRFSRQGLKFPNTSERSAKTSVNQSVVKGALLSVLTCLPNKSLLSR